MLQHDENSGFGVEIAGKLRQPWAEDRSTRLQTAGMCAAILINALAHHENLSGHHRLVRDIATVKADTPSGRLTKSALLDEWQRILDVNYWPIFNIARELLSAVPSPTVEDILPGMADAAVDIHKALQDSDVAGVVLQRLIADRQSLATYYTRPQSATLAAHLAIPEDLDWSDPDLVKDYHIADYACGTGALMLAAYQRVRELHRDRGGDPDELHAHMMDRSLTACDVMPAAVHLSASLLSSVAPARQYRGTRSILYPYGGVKLLDKNGEEVVGSDGEPVFEMDSHGRPLVDIGSLELLDLKASKQQAVMPMSGQTVLGASGGRPRIEVDVTPMSVDLVIMNPPFTTPTNRSGDHAETRNPAFAAFGTTHEEQEAIEERVRKLSRDTVGDGMAGLGSQFAAIADNMVKQGGHIALILPVSAMLGGSFDGNHARSWQKLRGLLAERYNDVVVTTIAQPKAEDSAFSADTQMAECLIVARRLREGETPSKRACFVNLRHLPRTNLEAAELARSIRRTVKQFRDAGDSAALRVGGEEVGWARMEAAPPTEKWTAARVSSQHLLERVRRLSDGELVLSPGHPPISIPITQLSEIGEVGPVHRSILGAFRKSDGCDEGAEYPMLWSHDELRGKTQVRMLVPPDSSGAVKPGHEEKAGELWKTASHLHICNEFGFTSNAVVAGFTRRLSLGGRAWPSVKMESPELEKAVCVWMNSTLGLIGYWIESNRTQDARGGTTVTAMPKIASLDVRALKPDQIETAVKVFDVYSGWMTMLPASQAYRDVYRRELDERLLVDVLSLDWEALIQLAALRNQWCAEPTVRGAGSCERSTSWELERAVERYHAAKRSATRSKRKHAVDEELLRLVMSACDSGYGNQAVAAARMWHRGDVPGRDGLKALLESEAGDGEVPTNLNLLQLREHVWTHLTHRSRLDDLGRSVVDEEPRPRGNPDLGDDALTAMTETLAYENRDLYEEWLTRRRRMRGMRD